MRKLIIAFLALSAFTAHAQDTARADARLTTATVYYGYGAELTHETKVSVRSDVKQIVISQLSTAIDENSLQISVPDNVALLSHKFSVFYPAATPVTHPSLKKIQDSLTMVNTDFRRNRNLIAIEELTLEKTGKLIETVINNSGNKTVSADETMKLINAYNTKIERSKTAIFILKETESLLAARISALEVRINEVTQSPIKAGKPYGQLVLQVICKSAGEILVSFSYFTKSAGWAPLYDLKVNSKTNEIKLVYKASVTQTTGIDWKQTRLTLSTSNPNLDGTAPLLTAWFLQLYVPQLYKDLSGKASGMSVQNTIPSYYNDDKKMLEEVVITGNGISRQHQLDAVKTIDPSTLQRFTTLSESQLNTNFEIDLPYDIQSNGELHSVTIKDEKINAMLKNYAVPKLNKDAYLLAEVSDWQNLNLLPGYANIIMDNTYLGKSFIDPNSTSDTLNLSLGKDRRIAIKRDLVKDFTSTKTNGNTTKQTFTYEITVKNNKLTQVDMILKDQYPISTIKDIEVKLEDDGKAAVNAEIGVLTWKVQLKPGESKKLRFTYSVKYPKEQKVANL